MATAAESRARERQRIKSGVMHGLSRLILYSDRPGEGEASRWSQLVLTDVKGIPPGIEANYKLSKNLRKQRVGFFPKDKDIEPFKSVVFCRVEEGVTVEEVERVFHQQIWRQFLEYMKGKPNIAANRAQAYCQLTATFPEGLFHGYSYPNLLKGEDYTLEILSGKRGETGSISVNESDAADDNQDGLDLGSGAGSDCDEEEGDLESQCLLPATQKNNGSLASMLFPESTPKKKRRNNKENEPPSPQASPFGRNAVGDDDGFTNQSMSIIPSSMCLAATAMTTLAMKSAQAAAADKARKKQDSAENPQPSTSKAGTAAEENRQQVSAENPQPSTSRAAVEEDPPMDPFAQVTRGSKHGKGTKGLKGKAKARALEAASKGPANKKAKKQQEKMHEQEKDREGDDSVVPEDLGNSDDEFEEESEGRRAARKIATLQELKLRKKRHICGTDCRCDAMSRGALRDAVSTTPEAHMRENLRYLDFRQVMKAIGGLRGQVAALVTTVGEFSENQGAVKELAEKLATGGVDGGTSNEPPGNAGTPWASCAECFAAITDEKKRGELAVLLRSVTQRITHFPREAVRALFAEDLRSRVYLKRPPKHRNEGLVIVLGERYWVYPQGFTEFLVRHMVAHVSGVPDRETAEDKLRGYFNETRKRAKREQMAWFKEDANKGLPIFGLCYKDTACEVFEITEEPPLRPPAEATDAEMEAFRASQAEFVERMEPAVEAAFNLKYPRGRHFVPLADL